MGDSRRVELLNEADDVEMRVVSLIDDGQGNVMIEECTDGELTYASFGEMGCVRRLSLSGEGLSRALQAMGRLEAEAYEALRILFAEERATLSDVLDALEAQGIEHRLTVETGGDVAFRCFTT